MKESIEEYVKDLDKKLKKNKDINYKRLMEDHLNKISFYQHERLIHLIVTLFYALFLIAVVALSYLNGLFIIIFFILFVFLIFYVRHYFYLENNVQYMYKQYNVIRDRIK